MNAKENPGLGAGVEANIARGPEANATATAARASLTECPLRLTSQRFPGKRQAILHACDRGAALRAVADFVHAGMFVRHVAGTYGPLTRDAIANEAWQYARHSKAAKEIKPAEVAAIVASMDSLVREKCAG